MDETLAEPVIEAVLPTAGLDAAAPEAGAGPAPAKQKQFDRSIVEGPLTAAVWKIAWPAVLTNIISGLQGWVDHIMVGHLLGFKANAAIGVSFQIFLVVVVFVSSIFIGMSVLVARFAGRTTGKKSTERSIRAFLSVCSWQSASWRRSAMSPLRTC